MNKFIFTAIAALLLFAADTKAQITMPALSPTQTIKQDFGIGKIELTYSRPSIRGRKVLGEGTELVPFGKPWRTGANAATKISFTDPVTIGGTRLDSGTYVIYTVPTRTEWDVVFSKGTAYPGGEGFNQSDDVVRLKVPAGRELKTVETFTMQFADVKNTSLELQLMWGNTIVKVPITTDFKDKLRKQVESAMQGEKKPYQAAANYYYEYEKDYPKALENINKAIEGYPKGFWMYMMKARIQKDMGDTEGARASARKTIEVATEAKNDDYVRMANEFIGKL